MRRSRNVVRTRMAAQCTVARAAMFRRPSFAAAHDPRRRAWLMAAALAASRVRAQPAPPEPKRLRVIAFAGGWNLPLWVAQREGHLEREGLALELAYTPSSTFLLRGLMDGRFDVGYASIDNAVAYQEG